MAKTKGPLFSMEASGRFGEIVYDKRGHARVFTAPTNPQTVDQQAWRAQLGDLQREVKAMGSTLRVTVKTALGYQWASMLVGELTANNAAKRTALLAAFDLFSAPNKAAWAAADPAFGNVDTTGAELYMAAQCLYDVSMRLNGTAVIVAPIETNSAAIAAAWTA